MVLSKNMVDAIEMLKQEEFYLFESARSTYWSSYNLPKHIRTSTMAALNRRGMVMISYCSDKNSNFVAKLVKSRCN